MVNIGFAFFMSALTFKVAKRSRPASRAIMRAMYGATAASALAIATGGLGAPAAFAQGTAAPETGVPNAVPQDDSVLIEPGVRAGELDVPAPPADAQLPAVEPIILDEEFNEAVPPLIDDDAALGDELESIAEFERRFAAEDAQADAQADAQVDGEAAVEAPLGRPELADGDPVEEIADAPVRDAELTAPLSPLEEFETREVEFAEEASDEEILVVNYGVQINGLDAADDETDVDLAAVFDNLSTLEDADGEAANIAMLSARVTEDSALLQRILRAEGWYQAAVTTRIDRSEAANGQPLLAVLDVAVGDRYVFSDIVLDAQPTQPVDLIERNFALKVGEPIIAARVQGAEAQVAVALPEQGYPFVDVGQRDILLDPETADGVYTLPIDTGPRALFGGFTTSGNLAFDAEHVDVLARFERGELYDSRKVDDLRQALIATGLLSTVSVVPERTGEVAAVDVDGIPVEGTQYVTVAVEQEAGPPRTIAGSAGFGTGQGVRLEGSWSHRNLFPPEGALIGSVIAGTQEQGAGVTFRRSNAGRRDRTVEAGLNVLRQQFDAFDALTGRLGGLISYSSTPIWQKRFTYAYGAEVLASIEEDFDLALGERVDRTYFIGALTGQVGFDTSDSLLNPTEGFRITALVQPEGSLQDGFSPYVRGVVNGSAYFPVGNSLVLAGRVRVGTVQGVDREDIAPSRRFYAGGGGSVRGFGFQDLGPQVLEPNPSFDITDPEETADEFLLRPIGGLSVNELAAEVRYRFGDFGVVGFVDAGQVYEGSTPDFSGLRYGVGVGARYYTNFGPLRVDIATPIDRQEGESLINLYISIGQAF